MTEVGGREFGVHVASVVPLKENSPFTASLPRYLKASKCNALRTWCLERLDCLERL